MPQPTTPQFPEFSTPGKSAFFVSLDSCENCSEYKSTEVCANKEAEIRQIVGCASIKTIVVGEGDSGMRERMLLAGINRVPSYIVLEKGHVISVINVE